MNQCTGAFDPGGVAAPPQVIGCPLNGGALLIDNPTVDGLTFTYPITITWAGTTGTMSLAYNYV